MVESEPTVSVVIPTYNRPYRVKRAIQSVLMQSYSDFELIVVDDASDEDVAQSVSTFSDERLQFIQHETNKNANAARNTGIRHSNGEYIAFLDDDDVWLPYKLQFQVRMLNGTPADVAGLISAFYVIDMFENELDVFVEESPKCGTFTGVPSRWLIKRKAVVDIGMFDEEMPTMQDLEFSARLHDSYEVIFDNFPVAIYYQRTERKNIEGRELLISKHADKMSDGYKYNQLLSLGTSYLEASNFELAWKRLVEARSLNPTDPRVNVLCLLALLRSRRLYEVTRKAARKTGLQG